MLYFSPQSKLGLGTLDQSARLALHRKFYQPSDNFVPPEKKTTGRARLSRPPVGETLGNGGIL
jgi:hypothetical protein